MSAAGLKEKLKEAPGYLFVPALILMLTAVFAPQTPVFDALPSEFGALARLAAVTAGVLCIVFNDRGETVNLTAVIAVMAAVGAVVMYESGITYVFDIALMVLLFSQADIRGIAVTVFSYFVCVTGATVLCAYKGYIRSFIIYGHNTYGFRNLAGLYLSVTVLIISLVLIIMVWLKDKKTAKIILIFAYGAVLSAGIVVLSLKALNLAAAVEPGVYELYSRDTDLALEVRMKGFEDYQIGFGIDEATEFTITPDGDHFLITLDSYGVTKTLCVIDERVFAGNYEQSEIAHEWDISAVAGTPYFTVKNVETGLYMTVSSDGAINLTSDVQGEDSYLRIGSENASYYEKLSSEGMADNDLRQAIINVTSSMCYTGSPVRPSSINVVLDGVTLEEGRDYVVTCWNNIIPGTCWADIRGIGDYTGTQGVSYELIYGDDLLDDPFYEDTVNYVVRAYRMGYMRFPELEEIKHYTLVLIGSDRTPDSVIWDIYRDGGLSGSNAQFMEAVYRLMLLRNGSRGELRIWIAELDSGVNREDVINDIAQSPDYQNIWHGFGIGFR